MISGRAGDEFYDVVVVGSGVAGLSAALGLAETRRVALVTSGPIASGSTVWAQGGLAAAIGADDNPQLHGDDTAVAGAGACDPDALAVLTEEAPASLADLLRIGGRFDRGPDGRLSLTREGGHHRRRIVHAGGDASGREVSRSLVAAVLRTPIDVLEHTSVMQICRDNGGRGEGHEGRGAVSGVIVRDGSGLRFVSARAVVLATGGLGGLYPATTNPAEVTGAGLGLALRAGASLVDLEFVQFHPTALRVPEVESQIPLISEALRGEGAVLRDAAGARVMAGHHPLADLAPRDIVARRIDDVLRAPTSAGGGTVVLDATHLSRATFQSRFPTIYDACLRYGVDPVDTPIPVAPAQHFLCGGVRTDRWGATDVPGLYAVGEVAATGVHGANRLASNSLVEAMVFGRRLASRLVLDLPGSDPSASTRPMRSDELEPVIEVPRAAIGEIRATLSRHVGIRRDDIGLHAATSDLLALRTGRALVPATASSIHDEWLAALALVTAAAGRRESRGCHWRDDFPSTAERWQQQVLRLSPDGLPAVVGARTLEPTS